MRYEPLDATHQNEGSGDQSRFLDLTNNFADRETGKLLDTMFYYWQAQFGDGRKLPHVQAFNSGDPFGDNVPERLSVMITQADDPANFMPSHLWVNTGIANIYAALFITK